MATSIEQLDSQPAFSPPVIDSYGGVSLHRQSHGESFLALVQNRFGGHGLYLLDEPEAALSPTRQLSLLALLDQLVREDSQLIIATHSPILMALPGAEILQFSQDGVEPVSYRDTEHYQITRRFLEDPDRMLRYLLEWRMKIMDASLVDRDERRPADAGRRSSSSGSRNLKRPALWRGVFVNPFPYLSGRARSFSYAPP